MRQRRGVFEISALAEDVCLIENEEVPAPDTPGAGPCLEAQAEEAVRPNVKPTPQIPSKEERNEHMITHTLCRSWCRRCVFGQAEEDPRRRSPDPEGKESTSLDYAYMCTPCTLR